MSFADWRPGDQPVYISDVRKARETFGWSPRTDWQTGVRKLIQWVKENEQLLRPMFEEPAAAPVQRLVEPSTMSSKQALA